jgi:hypothetical protein
MKCRAYPSEKWKNPWIQVNGKSFSIIVAEDSNVKRRTVDPPPENENPRSS